MQTHPAVDAYIAKESPEVQEILNQIRAIIADCAPDASEKIGYGMPAYALRGPLVYFSACKKHVGFYPTPAGIEAFQDELSMYKTSKGAIQFPYNKPIPYDLIRNIVRYRVAQSEGQTDKK